MYRIEYHISALFITLFSILDLFLRKDIKKTVNKSYLILALSHLVAIFLVIFTTITNNSVGTYSLFFRDIVNHGFLITHNASSFIFPLYIMLLLGFNLKHTRRFFFAFSIPFLTTILLLLLNPWQRWIFYYNEAGIYSHGKLIYALYVNALFYLIYSAFLIVKLRKSLPKAKYYALFTFLAMSVIPVIIQMFLPYLNIEIFLQSLGILGVLWSIENRAEIYNSITDIYNRFAFLSDVNLHLNNEVQFDILTLKLSDLSYLNSSLGLDFMNKIVAKMTAWMSALSPRTDVYDCEKGHFALINFKNSPISTMELVKKIKERFRQEWVLNNTSVTFPIQLSVINVPQEVDKLEQILFLVDAPYNQNQFLESKTTSSGILANYQRKIQVLRTIEEVIERQAFTVHYQPIWDESQQKFTSAEALVRMPEGETEPLLPNEFIPLAEKNGAIIQIGELVLKEVCRLLQHGDFNKLGLSLISLNLSVVQLMDQKLVERFQQILSYYKTDPSRITLEITESATANNPRLLLESMERLRKLGFSFALDDYGTGYSNAAHILNMPFEIIKLDKSILWSTDESENARIMLQNTIKMMKEMKLKVVVEGVETVKHKQFLTEHHCDYLQGYLFARPMPQQRLLNFLQSQQQTR